MFLATPPLLPLSLQCSIWFPLESDPSESESDSIVLLRPGIAGGLAAALERKIKLDSAVACPRVIDSHSTHLCGWRRPHEPSEYSLP